MRMCRTGLNFCSGLTKLSIDRSNYQIYDQFFQSAFQLLYTFFSVACSIVSHCPFNNLTVLGNALQPAHTHASTPSRSFIPTQFVWYHVKHKLHRIHSVLTSLEHDSMHKISSPSELHDLLVSCDACFPVFVLVLPLSLFVD